MTVVHVFTRHRKGCPKAADTQWKRCLCPKFLHWSEHGKFKRKAAGTHRWEDACQIARTIEEGLRAGRKGLSKIKVDHRPTLYFTSAEMDRIIKTTHDIEGGSRLRVLIELMQWSGLAIRDAVTLERSRLNEYDQILLYRAKTGVPVQITLPPDVAKMLRDLHSDNPRYFFWTGNGNPKSAVSSYERTFRRLFKKVNLCHEDGTPKRAFPHMFRDTFAVNMLLAGVPLHDVATLLGHSPIKTTEKHYSPWVMARQEALTDAVKMAWARDAWANKNQQVVEEI
jgi:integrase